jgi:hypothetical protein
MKVEPPVESGPIRVTPVSRPGVPEVSVPEASSAAVVPPAPASFQRGGPVSSGKRIASFLLEWALFFGAALALLTDQPVVALLGGYLLQVLTNTVMMAMTPSATLGQRLLGIRLADNGEKDAVKSFLYACVRALPPIELFKEMASASGGSVNTTEEMFGMRQVSTAVDTADDYAVSSAVNASVAQASVSAVPMDPPSVMSKVSASGSTPVAPQGSQNACFLQCIDGVMQGASFTVESGNVLGRKGTICTPEEDMMVSSVHCSLELRGDAWVVHDMESRNGTYVNGVRLPKGGVSNRLNDQDKIRIGREIFVFRSGKGR